MNTKIFSYKQLVSDDFIREVKNHIQDKPFHDGLVGNRVNILQKKRKDYWIKEPVMLKYMDNYLYSVLYNNIREDLNINIKYREHWKIGQYFGDCEGFYNNHTDTSGDTKYRKVSMICSLTDPAEYEGGELIFDNLSLSIKLEKNEIIFFDSSLLHRVNKVTHGIRTVLIGFFFDDEGCEIKRSIVKVSDFSRYIQNYIPKLDSMNITYNYNAPSKNTDNFLLEVVGDVDMSDKTNHPLWTDNDDYLFENNDSDILLITFAGMGWKNSYPTFIFHNFLKSYKTIDKLFLRDLQCRYYINGLKNSTSNFMETIEFYRSIINKKKYRKIVALGCSAGGFAAILYGQILKFDKVIAFSPQTVLDKAKEELIGDVYNAPKTCKWLRTQSSDTEYQLSLNLNNFRPFKCPVDIHYCKHANKGCDKKHALFIESNNCKLFEHEGNDHLVALKLRDEGKLKNIIDKTIQL